MLFKGKRLRKIILKLLVVTIIGTNVFSGPQFTFQVRPKNTKQHLKKLSNTGNTTSTQIISKNKKSYTAGTGSVYGPKLNQNELNEVAKAVAYFKNNYITDDMDNDTKIRIANEYMKEKISYIDWRERPRANTAYGALVENRAACSGYARAFKALMDGIGVSAYYIHADTKREKYAPNHQWNMVEYNDGYYLIDVTYNDYHTIDSNGNLIDIPDGEDLVYHAETHPHIYDTSKFPAIGSHSKK